MLDVMAERDKTVRFTAALAVVIAMAATVLGGCSPTSKVIAEGKADAPALLIHCMVLYDLAPDKSQSLGIVPGRTSWLDAGGVGITPSNAADFKDWYSRHASDMVTGKSLAAWQEWSAQNDRLPAQLCGSRGSDPSALHKDVYSQDPGAANPW